MSKATPIQKKAGPGVFTSIIHSNSDVKYTVDKFENYLSSKEFSHQEKLRHSLMTLKEIGTIDKEDPDKPVDSAGFKKFKETFIGLVERHFHQLYELFKKINKGHRPLIYLLHIFELMLENFDDDTLKPLKSDLIKRYHSLMQGSLKNFDWRLLRTLKNASEAFNFEFDQERERQLLSGFFWRIDLISDALIWRSQKKSEKLARSAIKAIKLLKEKNPQAFNKCLQEGRYEKNILNIEGTIIHGNEGGLFLLINSVPPGSLQEAVILEAGVKEEFLNEKRDKERNKVILGKGAFGKVRFAMSILGDKNVDIGKLVCVKKSKKPTVCENKISPVIESVFDDFFAVNLNESIHYPKPLDMAILGKETEGKKYKKSYLFMELVPENTADRVFNKPEFLKWEYQKPFIVEVIHIMSDLLNTNRLLNTDLKPENTLFDPVSRKISIIDLGSSIFIEKKSDLTNFDVSAYSFGITQPYCPPELLDETQNENIDLKKALSYLCGVTIAEITSEKPPKPDADSRKYWLKKWKLGTQTDLDSENLEKFAAVLSNLLKEDPKSRMDLGEAMTTIASIGSDDYLKRIINEQYVFRVKALIKNNPSALSLNANILEINEKGVIPQLLVKSNPKLSKNQKMSGLNDEINEFLMQDKHRVFLLLGEAGSGKSLAMQLQFIRLIENWKHENTLPIFFNLADESDLDKAVQRINNAVGSNLKLNSFDKIHFFIDSFDEADPSAQRKEEQQTFIDSYINRLKSCSDVKIVITCRTDFLLKESNKEDIGYFKISSNNNEQIYNPKIFHIAPICYGTESLESNKKLGQEIAAWLDREQVKGKNVEKILETIRIVSLEKKMNSALIFNMGMKILMKDDLKTNRPIRGFEIYKRAIREEFLLNWSILTSTEENINQEQVNSIRKILTNLFSPEESNEANKNKNNYEFLWEGFERIGEKMAALLASEGKTRLRFSSLKELLNFEKELNQDDDIPDEMEVLWKICEIMGLKMEQQLVKNTLTKLEARVTNLGFRHETYKNYYLLRALKRLLSEDSNIKEIIDDSQAQINPKSISEMKPLTFPKLISKALLDNDATLSNFELLRFFGEEIKLRDPALGKKLRVLLESQKQIRLENQKMSSVIATLLVAADFDFTGDDLSKLNLRRAFLRGANFSRINISGSDLSRVDLTGANLNLSTFDSCDFRGINLGAKPELRGHLEEVRDLNFSQDGKLIVSGSNDKTIKIWSLSRSRCLKTLNGHEKVVTSVAFSPNSRMIVSGSHDTTIKIWDCESGLCLKTLMIHSKGVLAVCFSPDGSKIASGCEDGIVKVCDSLNYQNLNSFSNPNNFIREVCFSPDSNEVVAAICDRDNYIPGSSVKIWNIKDNNLRLDLRRHYCHVTAVCYSPDGNWVVGGSFELINIYDSKNGGKIRSLKCRDYVQSLKFSNDGNTLAILAENILSLVDTQTFEQIQALKMGPPVRFNNQDQWIAGKSNWVNIKFEATRMGIILQTYEGHMNKVRPIDFSPDCKRVVTGCFNNTIKIWETMSQECLLTLVGHSEGIDVVKFSSDGSQVASGSRDRTLKLWDSWTGKCLWSHSLRDAIVLTIAFSQDKNWLFVGTCNYVDDHSSYMKELWKIDISNKSIIKKPAHLRCVHTLNINPQGDQIASGGHGNNIKVWDIKSMSLLYEIPFETNYISQIKFSADGKYIVSGCTNKVVKLWSCSTKECIKTFEGHKNDVRSVSFHPNGKIIGSGGQDGVIKIWDIESGACLFTHGEEEIDLNDIDQFFAFENNWNFIAKTKHFDVYLFTFNPGETNLVLTKIFKSPSYIFSCNRIQIKNCELGDSDGTIESIRGIVEQNYGVFIEKKGVASSELIPENKGEVPAEIDFLIESLPIANKANKAEPGSLKKTKDCCQIF